MDLGRHRELRFVGAALLLLVVMVSFVSAAAVTPEELKEKLKLELWTRDLAKERAFSDILPALETLLRADDFPNAEHRFRAYELLVYGPEPQSWRKDTNPIASPEVVELLGVGLGSDNPRIGILAAKALGRATAPVQARARGLLTEFGRQAHPETVIAAYGALGDFKKKAPRDEAFRRLTEFFDDKDPAKVKRALEFLAQQGVTETYLTDAAKKLLQTGKPQLIARYGVKGPSRGEAVASLEVRRRAAWLIYTTAGPQVLLQMEKDLDDEGKEAVNLAFYQGTVFFCYEAKQFLEEDLRKQLTGRAFTYLGRFEKPFEQPQLSGLVLVLMLVSDPARDIPVVHEHLREFLSKNDESKQVEVLQKAMTFFEKAYEADPVYKGLKEKLEAAYKKVTFKGYSDVGILQLSYGLFDRWKDDVSMSEETAATIRTTLKALEEHNRSSEILAELRKQYAVLPFIN